MSSNSELERLLREAQKTLPEPGTAASRRARERARMVVGRRPPRARLAVLTGVAFLVALGLGVGVGSVIAPLGTAAREPVGLGFLPEPGWFVLESGARASTSFPAVAMASSVPFDPDDDVGGAPESSGLPYSTLLRLPPDGVVITATFTPRGEEPWRDVAFAPQSLPVRLPTAAEGRLATQIRPDAPLGVYALDAAVNGYNLDLLVYFGAPDPSPQLIERAQDQLDRLVVAPAQPTASARPARESGPVAASAVMDRTYSCTTRPSGGIREIEVRAQAGLRAARDWNPVALASVSTGTATGGITTVLDNELGWVTAGRPSTSATVVPDPGFGVTYPVRVWGTLAVNRTLCRPAQTRIPLTGAGLRRTAVTPLGDDLDCSTSDRILFRLRASASSPTLKKHRQFVRTTSPLAAAALAVRTQSGRPLVYAEVSQSGKARLFTAKGCVSD
jgi:hypothetical protein